MAKISYSQIAKAIYLLSKEYDEKDFKKFLPVFVNYLSEKGMLRQTERILNALDRIFMEEEGHLSLKIYSRHQLSEKQVNAIAKKFKEENKAKEVDVMTEVREEILGGYKVKMQDWLIDCTLNNNLAQLQAAMIKAKK